MTRLKQTGYALIELLIVLSIIVLFSGLSLAYYRNFDEQRKLDTETKRLVDVVNLAAKKAYANDLEPGPNPLCADFQGYRFRIASNTTYDVFFNCAGSYNEVQSYTLFPNVTFSATDVGKTVLFKPLNAGTDLSAYTTITINSSALSSPNNARTVTICPVGTVFEGAGTC